MSKVGVYNPDNIGSSRVQTKNFYLEDGSNLYRLLPPFGNLAKTGGLYAYHQVYWLVNAAGKKRPIETRFRKSKDGTVLVSCPLHDKITAVTAQLQAIVDNPNSKESQKEAAKNKLKGLNLDKAYYLNVMDKNGEIGVLKMKISMKGDLENVLKQLRNEGVDPINPGPDNGVFLDFKRIRDEQGKVKYTVDVSRVTKKDPNTKRITQEYDYAPIDETVIERMENEARDVTKLFKELSDMELKLVASLDPSDVDRVFSRAEEAEEADADDSIADAVVPTAKPVSRPAPPPAMTQRPATVTNAATTLRTEVVAPTATDDGDDFISKYLGDNE